MADTGKTIGLIKALASVDPEAIKISVDDWLDDHPEATTTVEDGAITKAKLDSSLQQTVDDVGDLKSVLSSLETEFDGTTYTEETVSQAQAYTEKAARVIKSTGIEDTTSTNACVYTFPLAKVKSLTLYAQRLTAATSYYAFYDAADAAHCSADNIIGEVVQYSDRVDTPVNVPAKHCLLCISAITGRDATITITKIYKPITEALSDSIEENADNISALETNLESVEDGLTETMQTPQILPAGVAVTGNSPRDAAASADTLRVLNGQKVTFKGTATKLKFVAPPMQYGFAKPVTLFQFRLSESTYIEVYRETFIPSGNNVGEYDIRIPVQEGDVFGIGGCCGHSTNGTYGKTLTLTFDDNTVSFAASALSGAGDYELALYDVTVVPDIDVAKKAQISLLNSPLTLMRDWDIAYDCGKNLLDTSKSVMAYVNENGVSRSTSYALTIAKVRPNTIYTISSDDPLIGFYGDQMMGFFDESGTFLSARYEKEMDVTPEMGRCFMTPANCYYVAVQLKGRVGISPQSYNFDRTTTVQLEIGNHSTPYEPFKKTVSRINGVETKHYEPVAMEPVYDAPINLVVMGDSIASDARGSVLQSLGHWFYPMIEKYSFKSAHDIGVGGACWTHSADTVYAISNLVNTNNNVLTNQVNILIDHIENDGWEVPDVIFIHCGINDRGHALDGDTGTDYGDPDTAFDYDTDYSELSYGDMKLQNLCGAMRFAIELIWRNYPYTKIVMTTPLHTHGATSNTKTKALSQTIKACAAYLGIPVLDLNAESYIYAQMADNYLVDGLHPNVDKGGKLLADIIGHYLIEKFGGKPFFNLHDEE